MFGWLTCSIKSFSISASLTAKNRVHMGTRDNPSVNINAQKTLKKQQYILAHENKNISAGTDIHVNRERRTHPCSFDGCSWLPFPSSHNASHCCSEAVHRLCLNNVRQSWQSRFSGRDQTKSDYDDRSPLTCSTNSQDTHFLKIPQLLIKHQKGPSWIMYGRQYHETQHYILDNTRSHPSHNRVYIRESQNPLLFLPLRFRTKIPCRWVTVVNLWAKNIQTKWSLSKRH